MKEHPTKKAFYSVEEVAETLGVSTKTVYRHLRSGRIRARKLGSLWLVPKREIESLLNPEGERLAA